MTPHTTIHPFLFSISDDSGAVIASEERFVRCNEDDSPIWDHLFEVAEIFLEMHGFENPLRRKPVLKKQNMYTTHIIIATRQRFVCRAIAAAQSGCRVGATRPPG